MPTFRRLTQNRGRACLLASSLFLGTISGWWSTSSADVAGPQPQDRVVTKAVNELMSRHHLLRHPLDDEISRRGLALFLKSLDPLKVYFMQADINEFKQRQNEFDDMLRASDISYAYTIYNRLLKRIDERVQSVGRLLEAEHDFTVDEEMVIDPDVAAYAENDEEMYDRWRRRVKYDLLVMKGDKIEGAAAREKLQRRYQSFAKRMHQTDGDELLEMFLTSFTSSYDPHTTYMSRSTLANFEIQMKLQLEGIGAALRVTDGYTVVASVIAGGAASVHGKLKAGDRIVSVGQAEGDMLDVVDRKLNDVVEMIRGKAGTTVRLGVMPEGGGETQVYSIVRAKVQLEDSAARGEIVEEGKKADGSPFKVGVIDLPSFYMDMEAARNDEKDFRSSTRDVRHILTGFKQNGVDAVVLKLDKNGGGSLTEAINLTGLFIDRGPIVQVKDSGNRIQPYDDVEGGMAWDGPLVVVTSKFSASASEILAGAIQDYRRGLIVGDPTTHGKGTVQSLLDLGEQIVRVNPPNLGALKVTMQQYYRANGQSTQRRGVLADVVLPSIVSNMDIGEADLDYPIEFDKVPAAPHQVYEMVSGDTLAKIQATSQARRRESTDFDRVLKNIEKYREQKAKKSVTLNEQKFFQERIELNAEKEEEKQFEEQLNEGGGGKPVVVRDFYFNEVLAITRDYAQSLAHHKVAQAN